MVDHSGIESRGEPQFTGGIDHRGDESVFVLGSASTPYFTQTLWRDTSTFQVNVFCGGSDLWQSCPLRSVQASICMISAHKKYADAVMQSVAAVELARLRSAAKQS
jgi:hypothetical protein